eukprot:XP_001704916.1 Hypothetical protein GL50803_37291 [Giardia lamblia ATCC 50803]
MVVVIGIFGIEFYIISVIIWYVPFFSQHKLQTVMLAIVGCKH